LPDPSAFRPLSAAYSIPVKLPEHVLSEVTRGRRRGVASGDLCIPMVGLCYDTPSGEAMPFLLGLPETFPRALSSDFSQETCPSQPLGERLRRNNRLLEACIEGNSPLLPLFGFERRRSMRHSLAWRTALLTVLLIVLVTLGLPRGLAAQRPGHVPRIAFLDL